MLNSIAASAPLDDPLELLAQIHERPRNAKSIAKPTPEEASLMSFSETWPKA